MKIQKIAIIGAGNMGGSIVNGLLKSGYIDAASLSVADPRKEILQGFAEQGAKTSQNNSEAVKGADLVLFAVKPYLVKNVAEKIKPVLTGNEIIVSIAAGVELIQLKTWLGFERKIVRVIPNTAISVQESMTCISVREEDEDIAPVVKDMFDHLGQSVIINEDLMPAATVLASCGTAYALRYVRAAMESGIEMGFRADMAQFITAQTVKGAVQMIINTGNHPEIEVDKVSTPGGITITGLNEMEHKGFSSSIIQGLMLAFNKMKK